MCFTEFQCEITWQCIPLVSNVNTMSRASGMQGLLSQADHLWPVCACVLLYLCACTPPRPKVPSVFDPHMPLCIMFTVSRSKRKTTYLEVILLYSVHTCPGFESIKPSIVHYITIQYIMEQLKYEWWRSFVQVWSSHLPTNRWMAAALRLQLNTPRLLSLSCARFTLGAATNYPNYPIEPWSLSRNLNNIYCCRICLTKCSLLIQPSVRLCHCTQFFWRTKSSTTVLNQNTPWTMVALWYNN